MKKKLFSMFLVTYLITGPQFAVADAGYEKAINRHAQASVRDILTPLIEKRSKGETWNYILRYYLPKEIDSQCGYRSLVGLPEIGFKNARHATEAVVGKRFEEMFGDLLSRPNAKLELLSSKFIKGVSEDKSLISLKVTPSKPRDKSITFVMRLTGNGEMELCDIATDGKIEEGALYKLGNQLGL